MKVKELIAKLQKLPMDAEVYVDASTDYPEAGTLAEAKCWKDYSPSFRERRCYGWSAPDLDDVFLS